MSFRETLRTSLVTVAAVAALSMPAAGCVKGKQYQTVVPKAKETVETYVMEYDKVDFSNLPLAVRLYVQDNKKTPVTMQDLEPYMMVGADINGNGVLDYSTRMDVYKVDGKPYAVHFKEVTRAEATESKRESVREVWLRLNGDNSVTMSNFSSSLHPDSRGKFMESVKTNVGNASKMIKSMEKATRLYNQLQKSVAKPKGAQ